MRVLDLFSGLESFSQPFRDADRVSEAEEVEALVREMEALR